MYAGYDKLYIVIFIPRWKATIGSWEDPSICMLAVESPFTVIYLPEHWLKVHKLKQKSYQ